MKERIGEKKRILLAEIKKLGSEPMSYATAYRLSVCRGAYKAICMVYDQEQEWENDREEKADAHHEGSRHTGKLSREEIIHWVDGMENEDGTTAPHYTKDQVDQYRRGLSLDCDPLELYAAANMMYSDYCRVLKKYGADRPEVYMELAGAFLHDKDAGAEDKLAAYYRCIVES